MIFRKRKDGFLDVVGSGLRRLYDRVSDVVEEGVEERMEIWAQRIEERLQRMQRKIMYTVAGGVAMGVGLLFLVGALFSYMIEYMHWSRTMAFLITGILVCVIGAFMKQNAKEVKYG